MTETAGHSGSRIALASAFQRARRKFPKNFGLDPNAEVDHPSSESDDGSSIITKPLESSTKCELLEDSMTNQVDTTLVNSLEEVDISDEVGILCNQCQLQSNGIESAYQEDFLPPREKFDNNHNQTFFPENINEFENVHESTTQTVNHSYVLHENKSFILHWKEDSENGINLDSDAETDVKPDSEPKCKDHRDSSRRKKHGCKKSSRHTCSRLSAESSRDGRSARSAGCQHLNHCVHCEYYHRHCCCHAHCCCSRCCLLWRIPASSSCRKSQRRSHRERCSACRRRSDSPGVPGHRESRSRDSGIYTHARYENDEEAAEADEETAAESNALLHKDSLSILQEKYASGCRRGARTDGNGERDRRHRRRNFAGCNNSY